MFNFILFGVYFGFIYIKTRFCEEFLINFEMGNFSITKHIRCIIPH